MRVVEAKVARMLACSEEEAATCKAEGKWPPTRAIGVRVTLDCGAVAFWSFQWRTVSVTYPGAVQRYRNGAIITDEVGNPVHDEPRKNKPVGVDGLFDAYGAKFALLVLGAVAQAEREAGR